MDKIVNIPTVKAYNDHWGVPTRHPLVNVLEGSQVPAPVPNCRKNMDLYVIFLKAVMCADFLKYGRQEYDYQMNTLVFTAPGQVFGHPRDGSTYQAKGWVLYFSPELLHGTSLGQHIKDYTFFSYAINEALHLSERERETVIDCFRKIDDEINYGNDRHSNTIIASAIELFLNYCLRFYDRQFATRKRANTDLLTRFESLIDDNFASGTRRSTGRPQWPGAPPNYASRPTISATLSRKRPASRPSTTYAARPWMWPRTN